MRFGPRSVFCQDPKAILDALKLERDLLEKVQTVVSHQKRRLKLEEHVLEHLIQQLGEGAALPSSTSLSEHLRSLGLRAAETQEGAAVLSSLDEWSVDERDVVGDICERALSDIGLPEGITGQFPDTVRRRGPPGTDSEGDEEDSRSLLPQASSRSLSTEEVTETRDRSKRQRVVPEEEQYPILYGIKVKRQA